MSRWIRLGMLVVFYGGLLSASLYLGYLLRFDFKIPQAFGEEFIRILPWVVGLKLVILASFGQYRVLLSYFRLPDLYRVFWAMFIPAVVMAILSPWRNELGLPPRSVLLADLILSICALVGFRTGLRVLRERKWMAGAGFDLDAQKRVAIIGAGQTGSSIVSEVLNRRYRNIKPMCFLDDDTQKWGLHVHGVPVLGSPEQLAEAVEAFDVSGVVFAIPHASHRRIRDITTAAKKMGLEVFIVPGVTDLASGKVRTERLRPVEIEDLLGREPVALNTEGLNKWLGGKTVLVTGAGGSIGTELSKQILEFGADKVLLIDRSETLLFQTEQLLINEGWGQRILPMIADITDEGRMSGIFKKYRPQMVFHAAAHKHVPLMEAQPREAIRNNTLGTLQLANMAMLHEVSDFVFISTDKAINPTSVMGVSKRLGEIVLQDLAERSESTRFCAVRFGNVLGSSGSVIPTFRRQIESGGPVTVTDARVTRYFMTLSEAVGLVLQCGYIASEGKGETKAGGISGSNVPTTRAPIFVLDMGEPIRILDLARQMITLSGLVPEEDIKIELVGLRPGEKLFEEIQHADEHHCQTMHPKVFQFMGVPYATERVESLLAQLSEELGGLEDDQLKQSLKTWVPEYQPFLEKVIAENHAK